MTADANPLTERAKGAPTVSSGDLRSLLDALDRLGYDAGALLAGLGLALDRPALMDPDARVPCWAHQALIGAAQAQRFTPT